jgi:hypothetical protein
MEPARVIQRIAVTIMIIELASVPPAREEWKLFSTKDN